MVFISEGEIPKIHTKQHFQIMDFSGNFEETKSRFPKGNEHLDLDQKEEFRTNPYDENLEMQVELVERNLESFQNIIYGSEQDSYHTDRLGNRYSNNYDGQRWGNVLGTDVNDLIYTQSNRSFHYSNANAARSYLTTKGGTGHDRIRAGEGIDYLYGEDGNDEIYAGNNSMDKLYGGADRDTLSGGYLQEGGTGNDTLIEGLGMYGNEGKDTLIGGLRDSGSRMWGGEGRDKFIYNEPDGGGRIQNHFGTDRTIVKDFIDPGDQIIYNTHRRNRGDGEIEWTVNDDKMNWGGMTIELSSNSRDVFDRPNHMGAVVDIEGNTMTLVQLTESGMIHVI